MARNDNSGPKKMFEMSLHAVPEVRTSGAFHDEARTHTWTQPRDMWQGVLFQHSGLVRINGLELPLTPNDFIVIPPGSSCKVEREGDPETFIYMYFSFCPAEEKRDLMAVPLQSSLGEEGAYWNIAFRRALTILPFTRTHMHAVVYSLLWSVAKVPEPRHRSFFVAEAERLMEQRLGQPLRIAQLAQELSISQSQLTRLFLLEHGATPLQYLRERRAEKAYELLMRSAKPIKQIANECGFADVQAFNRFTRERLGASPRRVRSGQGYLDIFRLRQMDTRE
jgi:AraC-like DNA-binding protein